MGDDIAASENNVESKGKNPELPTGPNDGGDDKELEKQPDAKEELASQYFGDKSSLDIVQTQNETAAGDAEKLVGKVEFDDGEKTEKVPAKPDVDGEEKSEKKEGTESEVDKALKKADEKLDKEAPLDEKHQKFETGKEVDEKTEKPKEGDKETEELKKNFLAILKGDAQENLESTRDLAEKFGKVDSKSPRNKNFTFSVELNNSNEKYYLTAQNTQIEGKAVTYKQMSHLHINKNGRGSKVAMRGVERRDNGKFDQQKSGSNPVDYQGTGKSYHAKMADQLAKKGGKIVFEGKDGKMMQAVFTPQEGADPKIEIEEYKKPEPKEKAKSPEALRREHLKDVYDNPQKHLPKLSTEVDFSDKNHGQDVNTKLGAINSYVDLGAKTIKVTPKGSDKPIVIEPSRNPIDANSARLMLKVDGEPAVDVRLTPTGAGPMGDQKQIFDTNNDAYKKLQGIDWAGAKVEIDYEKNDDQSGTMPENLDEVEKSPQGDKQTEVDKGPEKVVDNSKLFGKYLENKYSGYKVPEHSSARDLAYKLNKPGSGFKHVELSKDNPAKDHDLIIISPYKDGKPVKGGVSTAGVLDSKGNVYVPVEDGSKLKAVGNISDLSGDDYRAVVFRPDGNPAETQKPDTTKEAKAADDKGTEKVEKPEPSKFDKLSNEQAQLAVGELLGNRNPENKQELLEAMYKKGIKDITISKDGNKLYDIALAEYPEGGKDSYQVTIKKAGDSRYRPYMISNISGENKPEFVGGENLFNPQDLSGSDVSLTYKNGTDSETTELKMPESEAKPDAEQPNRKATDYFDSNTKPEAKVSGQGPEDSSLKAMSSANYFDGGLPWADNARVSNLFDTTNPQMSRVFSPNERLHRMTTYAISDSLADRGLIKQPTESTTGFLGGLRQAGYNRLPGNEAVKPGDIIYGDKGSGDKFVGQVGEDGKLYSVSMDGNTPKWSQYDYNSVSGAFGADKIRIYRPDEAALGRKAEAGQSPEKPEGVKEITGPKDNRESREWGQDVAQRLRLLYSGGPTHVGEQISDIGYDDLKAMHEMGVKSVELKGAEKAYSLTVDYDKNTDTYSLRNGRDEDMIKCNKEGPQFQHRNWSTYAFKNLAGVEITVTYIGGKPYQSIVPQRAVQPKR